MILFSFVEVTFKRMNLTIIIIESLIEHIVIFRGYLIVGVRGEFPRHWSDSKTTAQRFPISRATAKLFPPHWCPLQIPTWLYFTEN